MVNIARAEAPHAAAIDLSERDLVVDLTRVACVIMVVVIHLLMIGVETKPDGGLSISTPIEEVPGMFPSAGCCRSCQFSSWSAALQATRPG